MSNMDHLCVQEEGHQEIHTVLLKILESAEAVVKLHRFVPVVLVAEEEAASHLKGINKVLNPASEVVIIEIREMDQEAHL